MTEIIGVHFKGGGKQYYFDPGQLQVQVGQSVIVETARGQEFGQCITGNTMVEDTAVVQPLRPVVRIATAEDIRTVEQNHEKEKRAFRICEEKIQDHELDMKLVDVEYSFEGNKILFFFTSEERVDFRALVKDLASALHARIELRQIGVRDEAKMLGGLGICGKPFCCSTFLEEFQPVSIKMAKTQNLSLNPTKISGTCGRLMCCLKYEQEAYEDLVKKTPKVESFVETPDGVGTVSSVSLLRQQVKVRLDSAPESPKCYHNCELCVIRNGKGKRPENYVEPPLEELAKLRRIPEEPVREQATLEFLDGEWDNRTDFAAAEVSAVQETVQIQEEEGSGQQSGHSRRRHRSSRGKRESGQPAAQNTGEKKAPEKKPAPEKRQGENTPHTEGQSAGEKKQNHRRRWRRRPRKPGNGGNGEITS